MKQKLSRKLGATTSLGSQGVRKALGADMAASQRNGGSVALS